MKKMLVNIENLHLQNDIEVVDVRGRRMTFVHDNADLAHLLELSGGTETCSFLQNVFGISRSFILFELQTLPGVVLNCSLL